MLRRILALCLTLALSCCLHAPVLRADGLEDFCQGIANLLREAAEEEVPALLAKAKAGDADAQFGLGMMYMLGLGVPQDNREAEVWFRKSAEQGNASAKEMLDAIDNERKLQDKREAAVPLVKSAEQGDVQAQLMTGMAYRYGGQGLPLDDEQAAEWFRRAAEKGNDVARCELGVMHWNGNGMRKDEREAEKWCGPAAGALQKAAEKGDALACRNVGRMRELGMVLPKDVKQAAEWYRKAAEQGDAVAQCALGRMCEKGVHLSRDDAQAVAWYKKAAEQGHAVAQYALGWMYRKGRGVTADSEQAATWVHRAAEQGLPGAQIFLGWLNDSPFAWIFGGAAEEWYKKGLSGLMKAAKGGDPNAMFELYLAYKGDILDDAAEAAYWRLKAEEQVGAETFEKWLEEDAEFDVNWFWF